MKKIPIFVLPITLFSMTLFAQNAARVTRTTEKSAIHVPPADPAKGLQTIYTNLGKSKTDLYNDTNGWRVSGPASVKKTQYIGMPFTPKSNSHVTEVQVAVQYNGSGANQVNLSLYSDTGGAPGTLLVGPVTITNLPGSGTCCTLTSALFTATVVTATTQYWVVADTPASGTGSDFLGIWDFVAVTPLQAGDVGAGWLPITGYETEAAGRVLGTIP